MLTSAVSEEIDEAASCPVLPKVKSEYSIESTNDSEQNWLEERDQISKSASYPVLQQQIRLDYSIQATQNRSAGKRLPLTSAERSKRYREKCKALSEKNKFESIAKSINNSEQYRPGDRDKIGDAASCPVLSKTEPEYLIETTNDREYIWLEENYEIDEAASYPVLPQQNRLEYSTQITKGNEQDGLASKRAPLTNAERSRRHREKLSMQQNRLANNRVALTNSERCKRYRENRKALSQSTDNEKYSLAEQPCRLTDAERYKKYRENVKSHPDLYAKAKNALERVRAYRSRQKLKRLESENDEEISQSSSLSQESTVTNQNTDKCTSNKKRVPLTSAERSKAYRLRQALKKIKKKKPRQTNAEKSKKYRERVKANPHLYKQDNSLKRTRAHRSRQQLQKLENKNHEEILQLSSSSEKSTKIRQTVQH